MKNKQRISQLNMLTHISNVIDSCTTIEQLKNSFEWAKIILKNNICFRMEDYASWDAQKMYLSFKKAETIVESKYKIKLNELKNGKTSFRDNRLYLRCFK